MRGRTWLVLVVSAFLALVTPEIAQALPPNAWAGQWLLPASETVNTGPQVVTLTQNGSSVSGAYSWCGGGTWSGTVSADQRTWTGR